jgi:hypothetical protein
MADFYFYRIDPDLHLYRPVQFFDPVYPGQKILVFGDGVQGGCLRFSVLKFFKKRQHPFAGPFALVVWAFFLFTFLLNYSHFIDFKSADIIIPDMVALQSKYHLKGFTYEWFSLRS